MKKDTHKYLTIGIITWIMLGRWYRNYYKHYHEWG